MVYVSSGIQVALVISSLVLSHYSLDSLCVLILYSTIGTSATHWQMENGITIIIVYRHPAG